MMFLKGNYLPDKNSSALMCVAVKENPIGVVEN